MGYSKDIDDAAEDIISNNEDDVKEAIIDGQDYDTLDNMDDAGLWEGLEPEEALIRKAVYSAQMDLREKLKEIYDELVTDYENTEHEEKDDAEAMNKVWTVWENAGETEPLEKGSEEEKTAVKSWLAANAEAGMWSGYPLGSCYIDSRCGSMYSETNVSDFVDLDHKTAELVPHLRGKYKGDVQAYFDGL